MRVFLVKIKRVYFAPNKTRRRAPPRVNLRLIDSSLEQSHEILEIHMKKSILSTLIIASTTLTGTAMANGGSQLPSPIQPDQDYGQDHVNVVNINSDDGNFVMKRENGKLLMGNLSVQDGVLSINDAKGNKLVDATRATNGMITFKDPKTGKKIEVNPKDIRKYIENNNIESNISSWVPDNDIVPEPENPVNPDIENPTVPPINGGEGIEEDGGLPPSNELPPIDAEAAIEYIGEQGAAAYASLDERVGSLENEMFLFKEEVNQRFDATNASLHAVTNARPMVADGQTAIGVGTGFAGSAQAIAIGAAHSFEGTGWSASATINQTTGDYTEFNGGAGVQYAF